MQDFLSNNLAKLKTIRTHRSRMIAIVLVLSLVVTLDVFWSLRQPGLTLAGDADCRITEHTHDEQCGEQVCICDQPETAHVHGEGCFETVTIEAQENRILICEKTEDPHTHTGSCYGVVFVEGTTDSTLICENSDEDHQHDDGCYQVTQTAGHEETVLNCDLTSLPHKHTDECFTIELIEAHTEQILTCSLTEALHIHDASCYKQELTCELEEHVHRIECYSDESADAETMLDWQNMFAGYPYTDDLRKNLVGIAKTQVGYRESKLNFEVGSDGLRRGYTRYGAWYGTPYRDWSAMFVSFCLNYAKADLNEVPINTGAAAMATRWKSLGKYASAGQYEPVAGDLVFFRDNTVGIVSEVYPATVYVIRGDVDDAVTGSVLSRSDWTITGWGCTVGTIPAPGEPADEGANATEPVDPTEVTEATGPADATEPENTEPIESTVATEATEPTDPVDVSESTEPPDPTKETESPVQTDQDSPDTGEPEIPEETEVSTEIEEQNQAPPDDGPKNLLDISNGPAVFIFEGGTAQPKMQRFALRSPRATTDLLAYLNANGGSYFFTLLDKNNQELEQDADGNYIVIADTGYKITISFTAPEGFLPGTYQYQVPDGLLVDGGEGTFILKDGTNVGSWVVTDDGLITLVFNEHMNSRTDITISATLGVHFPEQEEPIDFDGKISVTVQKPPAESQNTTVTKWGMQGDGVTNGKLDTTKIYWNVCITGKADSQIPGTTITDKVIHGEWIGYQHYSESDMAEGLRFGVSDPSGGWHSWNVYPGDPNLTWTADGWSYTMPDTITCMWCGPVKLGNDGWIYYVDYSSTPDKNVNPGTLYYMNRVTVDNQYVDGGASFTQGEVLGEVVKNGSFVTDAGGGSFLWEVQVTIPNMRDGEKAQYHWYLMDNMFLMTNDGYQVGYAENDAHLSTVTATINGKTIPVPRIQDATENDLFAWENAWTANSNGVNYGREINLLTRCQCNEHTCPFWAGYCQEYWYDRGDGTWVTNGFCQCWAVSDVVTFTFVYKTEDLSMVEHYGTLGYKLQNVAELYYKPNGGSQGTLVTSGHDAVPIPNLFKKALTHDFNGYTAHYTITLNEAKIALTNGSPLTIHDAMTDTLAYISGSLIITTEDVNGNRTELQLGTDYTVVYDGTGNQTDENGNEIHALEIVILHPQPVMYILDYDTTLIIPPNTTQAIKYSNSATITLWGEDIHDTSVEKVYADINIAAKSYKVEMYKTCSLTDQPLGGATFGLYNEHGGLITTDVTDANGELLFQTSIIEGIILREHQLYYMQELVPPPGYQLDDTRFWFCFCDETGDSCQTCDQLLAGLDAKRIPFEQVGKVHVQNTLINYDLPATGGSGTYPFVLVGVIFIVTPLVYEFIRRRKQERRGVG